MLILEALNVATSDSLESSLAPKPALLAFILPVCAADNISGEVRAYKLM